MKAPHRLLDVRRGEGALVLGCCLFFFCLLCCNYLLRPLREEMGIRGGAEDLPWLYTGTLVATLVLSPLFAWLVSRSERRFFIKVTYRLFALSLVGFYFWLRNSGVKESPASYGYYIWFSACNLLVISIFWGFLGDILRNEQAKRLYGLIGAGGTLGSLAGSGVATWMMSLESHPDPVTMLLFAAVLMEACVQCMAWVARNAPARAASAVPEVDKPDALTGMRMVSKRPYLQILCVYMVLQTVCATFLYQQRGYIVDAQIVDRAERVKFFAEIDLWVNAITLCVQVFFTGKLLSRWGITLMLLPLPLLAMGWFSWLAVGGSLLTIKLAMILSRACEFATAKPARETLYTVVSRAEKYQAKSFIDTFVYRGGDMIGAWSFHGLHKLAELSMGIVSWITVPVAGVWALFAFTLGRRQEALAKAAAALETPPPRA